MLKYAEQKIICGQSYWIDLDEDAKHPGCYYNFRGELQKSYLITKKRPWLIVSSNEANENSGIVAVVPISMSPEDYEKTGKNRPYHVQCSDKSGNIITIKTEQIRAIDKNKINIFETAIHFSDEAMQLVDEAIIRFLTGKKYYSSDEVLSIVMNTSSSFSSKMKMMKSADIISNNKIPIVNMYLDQKEQA